MILPVLRDVKDQNSFQNIFINQVTRETRYSQLTMGKDKPRDPKLYTDRERELCPATLRVSHGYDSALKPRTYQVVRIVYRNFLILNFVIVSIQNDLVSYLREP